MYQEQGLQTNLDELSRCEERRRMPDYGKSLTPIQITDAAIKESVYRALWEDSVLRALEYYEIDVDVKNGIVTLYGHIVGSSSQSRIRNAIQGIPGIVEIKNNLVLDDMLTLTIFLTSGNHRITKGSPKTHTPAPLFSGTHPTFLIL